MSEFQDFMTQQFEGHVLEKIKFLQEFGFGEIENVKVMDEEIPYWQIVSKKGELAFNASISKASTLISITRGDEYIAFEHYLKFIKNDELAKLFDDYFPQRFDMEAARQYSLNIIDLFAKHAQLGLKSVLQGKTWINVPYYWGDYK